MKIKWYKNYFLQFNSIRLVLAGIIWALLLLGVTMLVGIDIDGKVWVAITFVSFFMGTFISPLITAPWREERENYMCNTKLKSIELGPDSWAAALFVWLKKNMFTKGPRNEDEAKDLTTHLGFGEEQEE